ncbi:hypothetical protein AB0F72_15085 [Actinoplanes sp. NPDC023936]|uniref:hypothetical protein n=1 Tax=Actinoplanes sp. NPDC023936 TaxID=3154910 RepID=UPI00340FAF79
MAHLMKWWSRAAAVVTGAVLALVVPAHAWAASNGVADLAVEAARRRSRGGFGVFGFFGLLCCLFVVGGVVLAIVLISRNRKRR